MTECSWWNPVDAPPKNPGKYRVMNNENRTFDSCWNGKSWDPKNKPTGSLFLDTEEKITHWQKQSDPKKTRMTISQAIEELDREELYRSQGE